MSQQDSALSIAASITGILTFVGAVIAGFYARAISLRSAIDTQAEVSYALDQIELLHTETTMLNNAYLASQIRHPERKYGTGDFRYFQGLYKQSLDRLQDMDRELQQSIVSVTGGHDMTYIKVSRVRSAALWMTARERIHRSIEQRKAESHRSFQIQLAMLSAKIDELSYHQNHHNATCSNMEVGSLRSVVQSNFFQLKSSNLTDSAPYTAQKPATAPDQEPLLTEISKISSTPLLGGGPGRPFGEYPPMKEATKGQQSKHVPRPPLREPVKTPSGIL